MAEGPSKMAALLALLALLAAGLVLSGCGDRTITNWTTTTLTIPLPPDSTDAPVLPNRVVHDRG